MKILHVITSLLTSGAEHIVVNSLRGLRCKGYVAIYVCLKEWRLRLYTTLRFEIRNKVI